MSKRIIVLCIIFFSTLLCSAQETQDTLKQFEGKVLILRHPLHGDLQKYDEDGKVLKGGPDESWTVGGGILVDHITITPEKLSVEGRRIFFLFPQQKLVLFEYKKLKNGRTPPLSPSVRVEIELQHPIDSEHSAFSILQKVFALNTDELIKSLPDAWHGYLMVHHLNYDPTQPEDSVFRWREKPDGKEELAQHDKTDDVLGDEPRFSVGPGVKPPVVKSAPPPAEASKIALYENFDAEVVLTVLVDTDGRVRRLRISRPVGMGLDELALAAVEKWHFQPSTHDEHPVVVEMNVDVVFNRE